MEPLIDIRGASALLKLKRSTLYAMAEQRRIPFTKLGSRLLFSPEKLERWVDERAVDVAAGVKAGK